MFNLKSALQGDAQPDVNNNSGANAVAPTDVSSVSIGELRLHHERGLHALADLMVRALRLRAVAIWDDANSALAVSPNQLVATAAVKTLRSTWVGLVASDGAPPTLRSSDGRERLVFAPHGVPEACLCIELRTDSKRRRGVMTVVRDRGSSFADVTTLLGDFAVAIEAQCQLFTAAVTTRLALLESAERAARAGKDFPRDVDLRGSLARFLPQGGVLVYDRALRYVRAEGEIWTRFDGLSRLAIEGRTLHELAYPQHLERLERVYRDALAGLSNRAQFTHDRRTYELQTMPVQDVTGTIVAGIVLMHDVTDSRALDARLRRSSDASPATEQTL